MQMQMEMDWCSRAKAFKSQPQKSLVTSSRSPLTATVVVSTSPIEFNVAYQIPLQAMSLRDEGPKPCSRRSPPVHVQSPVVHFPADNDLVIVFEFDDDVESKETRSCYWEIFARDRARFKDRIEQASEILSPILAKTHRDKVYAKLHSQTLPNEDIALDTSNLINSNSSLVGGKHDLGSGDSCSSTTSNGKKSRRKRRRKCRKQKH